MWKEKLKIIPYGIDKELKVDITQLQEIKNKYNLENKDVITFFGSIRPNKGVEYLISSFSKVIKKKNNLVLLIAGSAPKMWSEYFNELKRLVKDLKIEGCVRFTGFVSNNDIPAILCISKIIVLPYTQSTQSGVLYHEVIPFNKPVIVTDVEGISETVKKYNIGMIVQPKDVRSLTNVMLDFLDNPKKFNKNMRNVERIKKQYSWNNVAHLHKKIYKTTKHG
ncbi:Alpha-D-kanosaminyltransferase [subsurface metagenome]